MLVAALGLTLLGFAFLVAAVATGQIAWAWACIGVGALGLVLLLVDLIRGRVARDGEKDTAAESSEGPETPETPDTSEKPQTPEGADARADG